MKSNFKIYQKYLYLISKTYKFGKMELFLNFKNEPCNIRAQFKDNLYFSHFYIQANNTKIFYLYSGWISSTDLLQKYKELRKWI